ncbi:MAG: carbohydrate kinase family protein [Actinomycetia bacterium]|nr:carbohydrate kinase family protein [Actinomycetes bacterium]
MTTGPVVCLGPYIVDVLARPVTEIPSGQGGARVEEIRITAAGTGGGTAVDLAQLGVPVTAVGLIGDDELADLLLLLLERHGVDTTGLVRSNAAQTSATVLPIRPNGERPALHCPGAYPALRLDDAHRQLITAAGHLHIGAPERFGDARVPVEAATIAQRAGVPVSVDLLAGDPTEWAEQIRALLPLVDVFCPNDDQIRALYDSGEVAAAAQQALADGARAVVVSTGPQGAVVVDADGTRTVPAFETEVIDTTGCGDSVSAGIIDGLRRGLDLETATRRGMAAAALVCERLGSDASLDPDRVDEVLATRATL